MADDVLSYLGVSVFCENLAVMLAAGIGPDEAVGLLCEDTTQAGELNPAATAVQKALLEGKTLADALEQSQAFPEYVAKMVRVGEQAGRTEQVLRTLAEYYAGRDALHKRMNSAVLYPILLLLLMTLILIFLVTKLLPVFIGVYHSVAGELTNSSYGYLTVASVVGWAALIFTAILALLLIALRWKMSTPSRNGQLTTLFERFPMTAATSRRQALAEFTRVLSIFVASGVDTDTAVEAASAQVYHSGLKAKLKEIRNQMAEGKSMASAFYDNNLYDPLYGRMLLSGARGGQLEQVLARLAAVYAHEADEGMDAIVDSIEPVLSFVLTVAVGATLLATMLPLVGILGAIG